MRECLGSCGSPVQLSSGLRWQDDRACCEASWDKWGPRVCTINVADVQTLHAEFKDIREDIADRWIKFAESLAQGEYPTALRLLIKQNEATMQVRGGAAWIEDREGRLHVRVRDEQGVIPEREELAALWRFPYFLDSLFAITSELRAK